MYIPFSGRATRDSKLLKERESPDVKSRDEDEGKVSRSHARSVDINGIEVLPWCSFVFSDTRRYERCGHHDAHACLLLLPYANPICSSICLTCCLGVRIQVGVELEWSCERAKRKGNRTSVE